MPKKKFRDGRCQVCGVPLDLATLTRTNVCYDHDPVMQNMKLECHGTPDQRKIASLQAQGYKVVVDDPMGDTFAKRYTVYQSTGFNRLKTVVVNDDGKAIALQG